jgi:hypothetical protein
MSANEGLPPNPGKGIDTALLILLLTAASYAIA